MPSTTALPVLKTRLGFSYYGDREGWWIAATVHRESDTLERSNWHVLTTDILGMTDASDSPDMLADAAVERISHFLVGWVDFLLVRPGTAQASRAIHWRKRIDCYGIADEVHFGELAWNEEWCVRCNRGAREDHCLQGARGCAKFRSQSDAEGMRRRWNTRSQSEHIRPGAGQSSQTPSP